MSKIDQRNLHTVDHVHHACRIAFIEVTPEMVVMISMRNGTFPSRTMLWSWRKRSLQRSDVSNPNSRSAETIRVRIGGMESNPDIQVACAASVAMIYDGVATNQEVLNAIRAEQAQELSEVLR
jgi:hypothetical protein